MVKRGMLFDPDHMSAIGRQQSLDYMKKLGYSGIVSSHSWADDPNYFQILKMGGVVSPHAGGSSSFLGKWAKLRSKADPRFLYGIGWGADINGFSTQGGPRNAPKGKALSYPFTGLGGTRIEKSRTGTRVWDFNAEGLSHYGQYPDWVEDIKVQAGLQSKATREQFTERHRERRRGLPADVGAGHGGPRRQLPPGHRRPHRRRPQAGQDGHERDAGSGAARPAALARRHRLHLLRVAPDDHRHVHQGGAGH